MLPLLGGRVCLAAEARRRAVRRRQRQAERVEHRTQAGVRLRREVLVDDRAGQLDARRGEPRPPGGVVGLEARRQVLDGAPAEHDGAVGRRLLVGAPRPRLQGAPERHRLALLVPARHVQVAHAGECGVEHGRRVAVRSVRGRVEVPDQAREVAPHDLGPEHAVRRRRDRADALEVLVERRRAALLELRRLVVDGRALAQDRGDLALPDRREVLSGMPRAAGDGEQLEVLLRMPGDAGRGQQVAQERAAAARRRADEVRSSGRRAHRGRAF